MPDPARALTSTEKALYVKNRYGHCPYCGGSQIEGGSVDVDGNSASQEIRCLDEACGRSWYDEYTLTGIVEKT